MWIVDWEYSGMNDPMWDLGDLSVEAEFDAAQEEEMIPAYFGGEPEAGRARPDRHLQGDVRPPVDAVGLIQLANNNPADDFWAYAKAASRAARR